jgi:outer membrane autotransporter protein
MPEAPGAASPRSPWSAWADTTYTGFSRDGPAATDGHASVATGGLDYRFSQPLIVGVMVGYENQNFNTTFNGGYLRGSGPTAGPYASWQPLPSVILNVAVGRAILDYSMSDGTGAGSYSARRDYVSASLVGNWRRGPWRFTPRANIYYARENHDGYVDSTGAAVPGATVKLGRASVGPEIGYTIVAPGGTWAIEPFAFGALDCDTVSQPGIVGADGIVVTDSKCGGRAGGGVKAVTAGNFSGLLGASYNSIGRSDQSSWSLRASAQLRF